METEERTQSNAVALATTERKPVGLVDFGQFKTAAEVFIKSGYFDAALGKANPEVMMARAQVKLAVGAEIGLPPFLSLQGIYWMDIEGYAPVLMKGAQVCSFVLARSSKYRYTTTREDAEAVTIEFEEVRDGKWVKVYTSTYTMEMAIKGSLAQKKNWLKNPIKMMWNRALVTGANHIASDELNGPAGEPDEVEWHEEPLIPETVQRATPPAAALADEAAKPAPEIAVSTPTTVAATSEKPKRKAKAQPVDPGPSDSEILDSAVPDDEGVIEHHSDEMPADADIADEPATRDQKDDMGYWMNSEKFDIAAAIKQHGWKVGQFGDITQAQYHELKADRDTYIKAAAAEFGWNVEPNLATTAEQRKQLVARHQKSLPRA